MVKNNKNFLIKLILLISIITLIYTLFIEYILGNQHCNLCILERIQFEIFFILFLTIIFLFGTLLSLYHLGIEQGLIQESLVCDLKSGSNLLSKEEILKKLQEKSVRCKNVTFKMFGLSLTSYNILISILITFGAGKIYFNYDKN